MPSSQLDRIGNGISYDHKGFGKAVRFCPRCGTDFSNLFRHDLPADPNAQVDGMEFWCALCGFSFNIRASSFWRMALILFRDHRKLRTMPRYEEKWVAPEVIEAYKEEKLKEEKLNSARGRGWSLGEKLKGALGLKG